MQTALILMTILGCDDSATQCHYVEMLDERWASIQACDAEAEERLAAYANANYPVVVAVCQTPQDSGLYEVAGDGGAEAASGGPVPKESSTGFPLEEDDNTGGDGSMWGGVDAPVPPADIPDAVAGYAPAREESDASDTTGLVSGILDRIGSRLPEAASLKTLVSKPVGVVTDSYSWVARRFEP